MGSYYEVLGLEDFADGEAVESAYRKLSSLLNPEVHGQDGVVVQKFKEISEAYAIISIPEQKELYDKRLKEMKVNAQSQSFDKANELNHIQKEMQLKFIESYNQIRFDKKIKKERQVMKALGKFGLIAFIVCALVWIIYKIYNNLPQ